MLNLLGLLSFLTLAFVSAMFGLNHRTFPMVQGVVARNLINLCAEFRFWKTDRIPANTLWKCVETIRHYPRLMLVICYFCYCSLWICLTWVYNVVDCDYRPCIIATLLISLLVIGFNCFSEDIILQNKVRFDSVVWFYGP